MVAGLRLGLFIKHLPAVSRLLNKGLSMVQMPVLLF